MGNNFTVWWVPVNALLQVVVEIDKIVAFKRFLNRHMIVQGREGY